jgi:hypothetical protein
MSRAQIQYPAPNVTVEAALPDGSIGEISNGYTLQNTDTPS